jgi:hypothetical protein
MSVAALRSPVSPVTAGAVDCLVTYRANTPRDAMGNRLSDSGRWLIIDAVSRLYGLDVAHGLTRDEHRRWQAAEYGVHASVAHCGQLSAVVLATGTRVGVDLQDDRDRPLAMAWLGELLGYPAGRPAAIRDFAECEALIKASHLTKEVFAGVRLPAWRPGWRTAEVGYQLLSTTLGRGMHVALSAQQAVPVRWWWQMRGHDRPQRMKEPG